MDPLLDPSFQAFLEPLSHERDALRLRRRLDGLLDPAAARAAVHLLQLRQRADAKFAHPEALLLTTKGLEQATPLAVARRRARIVAERAGGALVVDGTAGLGADALALAEAGLRGVAVELDARTSAYLRHNLRVSGAAFEALRARAEALPLEAPLLLLDPDRRGEGPREGDPSRWSPSWEAVRAAAARCRGLVVKLAPGTAPGRLGPLPGGEAGLLEWVSLRGELKELTLWQGVLGPGGPGLRRAAVALSAGPEERLEAGSDDLPPAPAPLEPARAAAAAWLAEPDPAALQAGFLGLVAHRSGLAPIAAGAAYLAGDAPRPTPLLRCFRVLGSAPLDRRRVRALLGRHDVGPCTVKRRGHPDDAETLARRLRGPGRRPGLLLVGALERGHHVWLVEREQPGAPGDRRGGTREERP